jgi:hypothetical protein
MLHKMLGEMASPSKLSQSDQFHAEFCPKTITLSSIGTKVVSIYQLIMKEKGEDQNV